MLFRSRLNGIYAHHTGKTVAEIEKDMDRDNYLTAEAACAYGLVDKVLQSRNELPVITPA